MTVSQISHQKEWEFTMLLAHMLCKHVGSFFICARYLSFIQSSQSVIIFSSIGAIFNVVYWHTSTATNIYLNGEISKNGKHIYILNTL